MKKLGFIGTGNIVRAVLTGFVHEGIDISDVYVSGKDGELWEKSKEKLSQDFGVKIAKNNCELVEICDYVIIALEPKIYKLVGQEIKDSIKKNQIFISFAPNVSINEMTEYMGENPRFVRTNPNVFAAVGKGMVGLAFQKERFTDDEQNEVSDIFKSICNVVIFDEKYVDMIPAMSGSAPAYMFTILEAMADAGDIIGFPRDLAYIFAGQAMIGAGTMIQEAGKHPCELKSVVCTPGGTTVEALKVFSQKNLQGIIVEGMLACYDKSKNLK